MEYNNYKFNKFLKNEVNNLKIELNQLKNEKIKTKNNEAELKNDKSHLTDEYLSSTRKSNLLQNMISKIINENDKYKDLFKKWIIPSKK